MASVALDYVITGTNYRDSGGRVLSISERKDSSGKLLSSSVILTDPINGCQIVLLPSKMIAAKMQVPVSTAVRFSYTSILDPSYKWKSRTEELGKQLILGVEFEGSRLIQTAEDIPSMVKTTERWYSDSKKMIGAVSVLSPQEGYRIRIQNLQEREPDPGVFDILEGYTVIELQAP